MNNRLIALIVIIIVVIIAGVYLYPRFTDQLQNNTTEKNTSVQNETQISPQNQTNTTEADNTTKTAISDEQARKIALQYIYVPGAYPGNANLSKWPDGRLVWTVPVIKNGKIVNGIVIDAQTGQNLGQG